MKRAIFPDSKLLQPMPVDNGEHANISGNVNSVSGILPTNENIPGAPNNISPVAQNPSAKNGNPFPFFALWCLIILVIVFLIIFTYKKFKRKSQIAP